MRPEAKNCFEIVSAIDEPLTNALGETAYAVLGGITTTVLMNPRTLIDEREQTITPPPEINLSSIRENGTQRDIDVLVMSSSSEVVNQVEDQVEEILGDELEVSVFGLKKASYLKSKKLRTILQVSSQRVEVSPQTIKAVLGPIEADLPRELFRPWKMQLPSGTLSVLHPIAHALCYRTRSINGVRPRDLEKLAIMEANIAAKIMNDDEYAKFTNWYNFASDIESLKKASTRKELGISSVQSALTLGKSAVMSLEKHPWAVKLIQLKGLRSLTKPFQ